VFEICLEFRLWNLVLEIQTYPAKPNPVDPFSAPFDGTRSRQTVQDEIEIINCQLSIVNYPSAPFVS
jgi:hypothetical protein